MNAEPAEIRAAQVDRLGHVKEMIGRAIDWRRRSKWAGDGKGMLETERFAYAESMRLLSEAWDTLEIATNVNGDAEALRFVVDELRRNPS